MTPLTLWIVSLAAPAPVTIDLSTWREAVAREAQALLAADAGALAPLEVQGLDPAHYLRRRKPVPGDRLRVVVPAALLMTRYAEPFVASPPAAFPSAMPAAEVERYRALEEEAWRVMLIEAIAVSRHAAAPYFLAEVCEQESRRGVWNAALSGLARTGHPHAESLLAQGLTRGSLDARQEVMRAAAGLRTRGGLALIKRGLAAPEPELQRAAVTSLGLYASAWAWHGRPDPHALREQAGAALVDILGRSPARELEPALIDALALAATPNTRAALRQLADSPAVDARARRSAAAALDRLALADSRGP